MTKTVVYVLARVIRSRARVAGVLAAWPFDGQHDPPFLGVAESLLSDTGVPPDFIPHNAGTPPSEKMERIRGWKEL